MTILKNTIITPYKLRNKRLNITGGTLGGSTSVSIGGSSSDGLFELRTDPNGTPYIFTNLDLISAKEITAYSSNDAVVSSIWDDMPVATDTTIGGIILGTGLTIDENGVVSVTGGSQTLSFANNILSISGGNSVDLSGLSPDLSGYATETWVTSNFAPADISVDGLSDVIITSILSGEILKWNGTTWVNNTLAEAGISAVGHTHSIANVTGLQTALDGKAASIHSHLKADITDFAHTHTISDVTNLQTTLDGKASSTHSHGNISNTGTVGTTANLPLITGTGGIVQTTTAANLKSLLSITKSDIGLGNVDNTSDLNKPISTATQNALNLKLNKSVWDENFEIVNAGQANEYIRVKKSLASVGDITAFNGDALSGSIWDSMPAATDTTLGGIKVGSGLNINAGVLSVDGDSFNLTNYYTKTESDNKYVPYTGASSALNLGIYDLIFQGADTGDIIWKNQFGTELHRLYAGTGTLNYRENSGTAYGIWHGGNLTNPVTGTSSTNYLTKWSGVGNGLVNSLIYDDGTYVGINTVPTTTLDIYDDGAANINVQSESSVSDFNIYSNFTGSAGSSLRFYRARGTKTTRTSVASNDQLVNIRGFGYDGTAFIESARINLKANGTIGTGDVPGKIEFVTREQGGSLTTRMLIDEFGRVGIGTDYPNAMLHIMPTSLGTVPKFERFQSSAVGSFYSALRLQASTDVEMVDGFGTGMIFTAKDIAGVDNSAADIAVVRAGADNTYDFIFRPASAGVRNELFRLANTGNLGLGVTNPESKISINFPTSSAYNFAFQSLAPTMTAGEQMIFQMGKSGTTNNRISWLYNHVADFSDSNNMSFKFYGQSNAMTIQASGNVGINNDSPSEKLDVGGNIKGTRLISTVAYGTAPLSVASTTLVNNLNVEFLGNYPSWKYLPARGYNFTNGYLVKTDIDAASNAMIFGEITANTYGSYNSTYITFQAYNFASGDNIVYIEGKSTGETPVIYIFNYDGYVYLWLAQTVSNQSWFFNIKRGNAGLGENRVVSVTNEVKPTVGITREKSFTPKKILNNANFVAGTDYVAPATLENYVPYTGATTTVNLGSQALTTTGNVTGSRLISTVTTVTAPLSVASTTRVSNLNVQYLNGYQSNQFSGYVGGVTDIYNIGGQNLYTFFASSAYPANAPVPGVDWVQGIQFAFAENPLYRQVLASTSGNLWFGKQGNGAWANWEKLYTSGNFIAGTHYQAPLTNPVTGTGTTNYLPKFTGLTTLGNSQIYDNGTNVGIGTSSPNIRLDIYETTQTTGLRVVSAHSGLARAVFLNSNTGVQSDLNIGSTNNNLYIGTNYAGTTGAFLDERSSGILRFMSSGSTKMIIDNGNVGIGTTAFVDGEKVNINGRLRVGSFQTFGGGKSISIAEPPATEASISIWQAGTGDVLMGFPVNVSTFSITNRYNTVTLGDPLYSIALTTSGNFGIGTTNPLSKLQVTVPDNINADNSLLTIGATGDGYGKFSFVHRVTGGYASPTTLKLKSVSNLAAQDNLMVWSVNGNIGINAGTPFKRLHISDDVSSNSEATIWNNTTTLNNSARLSLGVSTSQTDANRGAIIEFLRTNASSAGDGDLLFYTRYAGTPTEKMRISASGTVTIGGTQVVTNSGTWGISITGNAAAATYSDFASTSNNTTTNMTYFPTFVSGSSGTNAITVSNTKLTFNPSTGTLSATKFSGDGSSLTTLTAANLSGTIPSAVLGNSNVYIGTTAIPLNRGTGALTLTGVSLSTLTRGTGLTGNSYNGSAAQSWAVAYGTTSGTACQGNDIRLHTHSNKTNLDTINQDLATTSNVTFNSATISDLKPTSITTGIIQAGQTSNLVAYSNDFTNSAWVKTNGTITVNQDTNPFGGALGASKLTRTLTTEAFVVQDIPNTTTGNHIFSVWVKGTAAETSAFMIKLGYASTRVTKTVAVSTSWQRIDLTYNFPSHTSKKVEIILLGSKSPVYIWGAQLHSGTTVGLYTSTGGSQVLNTWNANIYSDSYVDGNLTAAKEVTAFSDIRLKKDISDVSDVLDKVNDVRVVNYKLINDNTDKERIGVIAQELENVFPEFVNGERQDYLSVNYAGMVSVCIKAIQELTSKVDQLENKLKQYEKTNT